MTVLKPMTVAHFERYASRIVLDTGDYWKLEDFQAAIVEPIFAGVPEVWAILPEGNGKAESVHTRLPTPDGWTTMLDVQPGDELLGSDGFAVRVTNVSEVKFGEDCYRVRFSDGCEDVVSGDHLWTVEDAQDHYKQCVRSTRFLYNWPLHLLKKGKGGRSTVARWRIANGRRMIGPDVDLPIESYVLGAWLGDGDTRGGAITNVDAGVWDELERVDELGAPIKLPAGAATRRTVLGLVTRLRALGLYGNKHIPEPYLLAGEAERWRLLQGLMDTDGTVSLGGAAVYNSTRLRLIEDVRRLCWSLGLSAFLSESRAVLNGVDFGPSYRLTIACDQRHPVCLLDRKRARLKTTARTADHRRITAVERVQSVPVKCVAVDALDMTYLTTDAYLQTHNTSLLAGLALYMADYSSLPWIPIAASSRDQAQILAQQAYQMIRASPGMLNRFRIYEGYRRILPIRPDHPAPGNHGIQVYAAEVGTGDGVIPFPIAICDEGHRQPDMRLYRLWKGKLGKRGASIAMISTAGEPGGEFEEMRDHIRDAATNRKRRGGYLRASSDDIVMNEWKVAEVSQISDMVKVKEANPLSTITVEQLAASFASPTMDIGDWGRLKCGIPARSSGAAVSETEWDAARIPDGRIVDGSHIELGVDVAWRHDTFAIVPLLRAPDYLLLGDPEILTPPRDGSTLHPDEVKVAFETFLDHYVVDTVVIDLPRAEDIAAWLEDEHGVTVISWSQSKGQHAVDYEAFMAGLRNGTLKHCGHSTLSAHVLHAVSRAMPGDKRMFDRVSASRGRRKQDERVIDGLAAASMVVSYASNPPAARKGMAGEVSDYRIEALV